MNEYQTNSVENIEINKKSNSENIDLMKIVNLIFALSLSILLIMAIRLISSIASIEDIMICLQHENSQIKNVGVLLIVEMALMLINLTFAILSFVFSNKLKKAIMFDRNSKKDFSRSKVFTMVMSILFTVFTAFEVFAVLFMTKAFNDFGVEHSMLVSISSLVWTALYACIGWIIFANICRAEKIIKNQHKNQ